MTNPDTLTPDIGLGILIVLLVVLVLLRRRDRRAGWGHIITDPSCRHHRPPTGWLSRLRHRRARGIDCGTCHPQLSRLDILDGVGGRRLAGPCLSHNITCTYPEPHGHGHACDRSCVCWRTAPSEPMWSDLSALEVWRSGAWTEAEARAFREAWVEARQRSRA